MKQIPGTYAIRGDWNVFINFLGQMYHNERLKQKPKGRSKMTNDKINQTIHEARGLCAHIDIEYEEIGNIYGSIGRWRCKKCKSSSFVKVGIVPDYTSNWSAWGAALEWAKGKEWWEKFAYQVVRGQRLSSYSYEGHTIFNIDLLNPELGSAALAEFINKHPEYFEKEVGR